MIPNTFCWTKMGIESGQSLDLIIRRKEWERQLGGGLFFWGIGQSLGENARNAANSIDEEMKVLFSPMPSKAKDIDVTPGNLLIWNSWLDNRGNEQPLPNHVLVTSRADLPSGRRKTNHYALICNSVDTLSVDSGFQVAAAFLRNFSSNKSLGASQVTAVVRNAKYSTDGNVAKPYTVSFMANMEAPYSVQLSGAELLSHQDVQDIEEISLRGSVEDWRHLVRRLRGTQSPETRAPYTSDLFWSDKVVASAL